MMKFVVTIMFCVGISLSWCSAQTIAPAPQYSDPSNWYGGSFSTDKRVDILFFPPTSVSEKDGQGRNMNPSNESQRRAMDYWFAMAKALFGEHCNFYGPYYRQVTMESWGKPYFQECASIAISDVVAAFDYYMKHHNNGHPFILAGHSQGALMVYSLIKRRITEKNYPQMVAAYPIGYRISQQDLAECRYIKPAKGSTDIGVCISYHCCASSGSAMYPNNAININPLNWSTGTEIASADMNLGSVFFDNKGQIISEFKGVITAQLDPTTKAVVVTGLNPREFHKPYVGGYQFRLGNYHLQDMNLFFRNLQQNVRDRIESYFYKTKQQ